MIVAEFLIKSGTCGWSNYDNCDLCLQTIKRQDNQFVIPPIGSKVTINTKNRMSDKYIVNDIEIFYGDFKDTEFDNTYIHIYVLEYNVRHYVHEDKK
jgi:hypothetical protein